MERHDKGTEGLTMESIRVYLVPDDELVRLRSENVELRARVETLAQQLEQAESRYRLEVEYNLRLKDENRELKRSVNND